MIDVERLARWMDGRGLGVGEPIEQAYVSGGSQNEIYEIRRGDLHGALRIPPPTAPDTRDAGHPARVADHRSAGRHRRAPHRGHRRLRRPVGPRAGLLSDGLRRRLVTHEHRRVAGAVRHRPRGPEGTGLRAGRRDLPAVQGRLAGQGPHRPGAPRWVPRTPGRPVDGVPRAHQGPRAARVRRSVGLAAGAPADRLRPRASCTATTSSPTSCTATALRPGWRPSWTGRWARSAIPNSTWPGWSTVGRRTPTTPPDISYVDMTGMPSRTACSTATPRCPGGRSTTSTTTASWPSGSWPSCSSRGTSGRVTTPMLQAYGPIVLDLMQGAAELAESTDYRS